MDESREREEQIFAEASALPPGERAGFLDRACGGNRALRRRVLLLLQAHDSAGDFMTDAPVASAPPFPAEEMRGTRIGRYKLLQKLGEGGCGLVWMAEQEEPVRRRVALKIIKLGMDTREVVARFSAERQALAMMDHPNIAKVLDAGATDTGRPFFVMELVHGIRITDYCDQHNLSTNQRLELFSQVCHAVQHAHQKGIIHRDLKPSNILVTLHDGVPVPKVIDFGIAKAAQGRLTDQTLFTAFEQFIGTPAYMSPEQAEMSGIDIDTRSDVYSLGVLLYELLTGRPPFDPKSLLQAGLDEIRRIIREVEPPKPSTNLSTLTDADRRLVAKMRSTDPARLSLLLRGDLDWIVMRCLEKDRTRRYETANGLAADIQRHLNDEPVTARPPGTFYRVRKFARRHRLVFAAAFALLLSLLSGLVISSWQAVRATRAERVARLERTRAEAERARAEDLLSFMLGDLRTQLAKVGRLSVLEGVGDKAMAYFASLDPHDTNDRTLARHAKALTQIGEIRMDEARYTEATAAFAEAYDRAAALVQRNPQDGDMLFERGQAEFWNGYVRWQQGELGTAHDWLARYHATANALVALAPATAQWRSELAYSQHNLAILQQDRREFGEARAAFQAEGVTLGALQALAPGDLELRFRIADVHSCLGILELQEGDFAAALAQFATQATLLDELVQTEPRNARWRFFLGSTLLRQTDVAFATGQQEALAGQLTRARRLLDELVAQDPANRRWLALALNGRLKEARRARRRGDLAEALRLTAEVRPQLDELVAADAADRSLVLLLATAWRLDAQVRSAQGEPGDAAANRAVELGEALVGRGRPSDLEIGECALSAVVAGEIAARAGDQAAAARQGARAAALLAPRLAGTHDFRLLDPAARAALLLGHAAEANATISALTSRGYVPLDPWPAP